MLKLFRVLFCTAFLAPQFVAAQALDPQLLLGAGGLNGLSQAQLQALANSGQSPQAMDSKANGQRNAVQNANDLKASGNILGADTGIRTDQAKPKSPIVEYFRVLTGQELDLFGADVFSFDQDPSILFYNSVANDYVLAAGDALSISLRGILSLDLNVTVNQRGEVTLPDLNPFRVTGMTLAEFEDELSEQLRVDDASARAFVDLDAARLIPVRITGSVKEPKTLALPAYTPLSRILGYIGELGPQASLRNITLLYDSGKRETFDLYDILTNASDVRDPLIESGVRVHFGSLGATVAVSGFGGRAAIYELGADTATIDGQDLFALANISLIPPGASIELLSFDQNGIANSERVDRDQPFQLSNGQAVRIQFVQTRNISSIEVTGATIAEFSVASSGPVSLSQVLRQGAVLTPEAVLEFALIETTSVGSSQARAVDLRYAFSNPESVVINPGEKLTVFTAQDYQNLLDYEANQKKAASSEIQPTAFNDLGEPLYPSPVFLGEREIERDLAIGKMLTTIRISGASEIFLDDRRVAFLAPLPEQSVVDIVDNRLNVPVDLSQDFAVLIDPDNRAQSARAFTIGAARITPRNYSVPRGWRLHLYSESFLSKVDLGEFTLGENEFSLGTQVIEASNPAEITIDGRRIALLPAGVHLHQSQIAAQLRNSLDLYPLYSSVLTKQGGTLFFNTLPVRLDSLIGKESSFSVSPGQRIDIFTTAFVRDVFDDVEQTITALDELSVSSEADQLIDQAADSIVNSTQVSQTTKVQEKAKVKTALNGLKAAAKLVSGAVEQPGFYPIAGNVTLAEIISVANGVLPTADITRIGVRSYVANASGAMNLRDSKKIDIKSVPAHKIVLTGDFDVQVPTFINNASVGQIVLSGEVQRPGEYTFSRSETLHDVIQRAGGLTPVAYPLGAVFTRDSLRAEQTAANLTLARQVEQSILSLSQSDRTGAGDQISAVLTFAKQLKLSPVSGRQTVNIALRTKSNPIYLQDGDNVFVPQRPSHISVIGSVFSQVSTEFNPNKSLMDYISDAGGFDRIADQKKVFMVLPNGQSKPIESASDETVIIPPGAVIVVPPKTDKLTALGLTEIISKILGNIATSLLAINAVK